jgi:hypothetical protein
LGQSWDKVGPKAVGRKFKRSRFAGAFDGAARIRT